MKICLIGGSNGLIKDGISTGIKKTLVNNDELINYSLGSATSTQRIYEILRHKEEIKQCDLLIIESFFNDCGNDVAFNIDLKIYERNVHYLYNELAKLNIKIISFFITRMHLNHKEKKFIYAYNIHKYYANHYGICTLDMHKYVKENKLSNFFSKPDLEHPLCEVMAKIGANIVKNINNITAPKCDSANIQDFGLSYVSCVDDFQDFKSINHKNSVFNEKCIELKEQQKLSLANFTGKYLLGIHSWNNNNIAMDWDKAIRISSSIMISDKNTQMVYFMPLMNYFTSVSSEFFIDKNTTIFYSKNLKATELDYSATVVKEKLDFFHLIGFLLCEKSVQLSDKEINERYGKDIILENDLTNQIMPDIVFAKRVLDEYNERVLQVEFKQKITPTNIIFTALNDMNTVICKSNIKGCEIQKIIAKVGEKNHVKLVCKENKTVAIELSSVCKIAETKTSFKIHISNITINNVSYEDLLVWHGETKHIEIPCKKDEELGICFEIKPYKYNLEELQDLLEEFYGVRDAIVPRLIYAYLNKNTNYKELL